MSVLAATTRSVVDSTGLGAPAFPHHLALRQVRGGQLESGWLLPLVLVVLGGGCGGLLRTTGTCQAQVRYWLV